MKYGKFVGKGTINFFDSEVESFKDFLTAAIKRYTNAPFKVHANVEKGKTLTSLFVSADFDNPINTVTRNSYGDRILSFEGIGILVYKEIGYLETWDWSMGVPTDREKYKDYDNAPCFQYSLNVLAQGSMIPYRHRHSHLISWSDCFDYGTSISDLNVDKAIKGILKKCLAGLY